MHFNRSPQKLQHLHCLMGLFFNVYLVKGAVTFLCTQNQCKVPANGLFKDFKLNCLIFIKIPLVYSRLIFSFFFTQHNFSERNCFVMKTVIYFLYLLLDDYYIYFSPEVQESSPSSLSSVFAFTSENPQGPLCHVDLSIKPNKPGNHTLCVKAKDQRFVKRFIT